MSRPKGAPPPGWRPTVKGKPGGHNTAEILSTAVLPEGGAAVAGSRFRPPGTAREAAAGYAGPSRLPSQKQEERNGSSVLRSLLGSDADVAVAAASEGYRRLSAAPGVRRERSEADDAELGFKGGSAKPEASKKPGWGSLFEDLEEEEREASKGPADGAWRNGSSPGPNWDRLFNGLEGGARKPPGNDLDYGKLFDGRGDLPDDNDDLPDLVSTVQPKVPAQDSQGPPEADEADVPSGPPPRRLVFDLDSSLVDLASHWQKYGVLGHFNLSGHADEGVEAWGEKLIPKGCLSLADFRSHGVELDLSDTSVVAAGFQELEEFAGAIKRDGTVTALRLARAKVGNSGASWIAGALMRNFTLTELVLSSNGITDEGVDPISALLDTNHTLRVLDLSDNRIGSRGASQLASGAARNKSLRELDLSHNSIGDQGVEQFLQALDTAARPRAAVLRTLHLNGNSISRRAEENLISAFRRGITVLQHLSLTDAERAEVPSRDEGKPPRFTVVCTQQGIEVRAGRAGQRAQVSWEQDQGDVEIVLKRSELRRTDSGSVDVQFGTRRLKILVRGELIMDIDLFARIRPDDCAWTVGDGFLQVVLAKAEVGRWKGLTA